MLYYCRLYPLTYYALTRQSYTLFLLNRLFMKYTVLNKDIKPFADINDT